MQKLRIFFIATAKIVEKAHLQGLRNNVVQEEKFKLKPLLEWRLSKIRPAAAWPFTITLLHFGRGLLAACLTAWLAIASG
jgi:hypothetical protein